MKTLLPLLVAASVVTPLLAPPGRAHATGETKLVCNQSGVPVFEAQYDGPRYADSFNVRSFDGKLVSKLLSLTETGLRISDSSITSHMTVGNCVATPTASDTILSCVTTPSPRGTDWIISRYQFAFDRTIGRTSFYENVNIERDLRVDSLRLTVSKKRVYDSVLKRYYTAAHVKLELSGQSAFSSFAFTDERTLGELVPESELSPWERCAFVK
jgi:hypothetical protein